MKFTLAVCFFAVLLHLSTQAQVPTLKSLLPDSSVIEHEGVPWAPTNFKEQKGALGLEEKTFLPNPNMEKAVSFWVKVYTQYRTDQGIIHDTDNLSVIYEKVDFDFINKNNALSDFQKDKARESYLEERKKIILDSIKKIAGGAPESEWTPEDKNIFGCWEKEGGIEALKKAAEPSRLRFQLGQSDRMKEAIYLSGRYLPMMERIFREEGLPIQLTRLVFVESSFDVTARSRVGASGLWQIMPFAARGKLKMNKSFDLRNHPQKATEFAAKMLKFNYQMLSDWSLAVTGYNHGPYGVKRLVERHQTRDLGELISIGEGKAFGFASRNFFASFLAALEVESKANEYFPNIRKANDELLQELQLKNPIYFRDLVRIYGGNRELAALNNPHLNKVATSDEVLLDSKTHLMVPKSLQAKAEQILLESSTTETRRPNSLKSQIAAVKVIEKRNKKLIKAKSHVVLKGETLFRISRQYGVSIASILSLNGLNSPSTIKAGQRLMLP